MTELFLKIINMSISASWLVLAVLALRLILKKAPKWVNVLLWGMVAVRLAFPFSIESALSLIPSAETIRPGIMMDNVPSVQTGVPAINNVINPVIGSSLAPSPGASANPLQIWIPILSIIWVIGVAALLLYTAVSYWRLRRKVSEAVILRDNIFQSENVGSPFVLGIIKPKVYLPYHMDEQELSHVVAHEQAHIRRKDHWWKPLGFLLLTIHWFNPLMWLAYVLLCRDIELACDEKVIQELGSEQRADYTQALVACSVNRRMIAACPLAFGEVGVKERVKSVMNYKKPAFWVVVLAVIACVVVAVCFLTNPAGTALTKWTIDEVDMNDALDDVHSMTVRYNGDSVSCSNTDSNRFIATMDKIRVGRNSISQSRDHNRDHSFTITINDNLHLHFSFDFSEMWVDNGVKHSFSYPITNPETARELMLDFSFTNTGAAEQWFDYLDNSEEMQWDGRMEANIPEFPDVTFRWYPEKMEAVTEDGITPLYNGMPIWSTYFCDLTGDGLPELCSTISVGSGIVDNRVIVYDYANGASYEISDRMHYDFILRMEDSGQLCIEKRDYLTGELIDCGKPEFRDGDIGMVVSSASQIGGCDPPEKIEPVRGQGMPNDNIREITDPTDDPNFAYATAIEKIYEDERNKYFISGLYSQHIIVHYTDGTQEDIVTALNAGRATFADLDKFGIRYWAEPKTDPLDAAISSAILAHYASDKPDGLIHVESHVLLANEGVSGTPLVGADDHTEKVTAYLFVHHAKYSTYGGALEAVGGSYVPTAITFNITDSGEYVLEEYWEPRDGSYYVKDIRDQFPGAAADDALNGQAYIADLKEQTYNKALAHRNNNISPDVRIEDLFNEIQTSPAHSSNPGDYIREHEAEYEELLSYGEYTLKFCFTEFLRGGQIDLRGHIMASACKDISNAWGEALLIDAETPFSGQEWFDIFRSNAESLAKQYSHEDLEKYYPATFLLLQMSNSEFMTKN